MANVIKLKRGSGSDPSASDLVVGEVAIRTDSGKLFTKKDNGTIAEISGSGGGSDIFINTLSSSSGSGGGSATFNGTATRFTLSNPPSVSAQQLLVSINGVIQKPNSGTSPSEGFAIDGNDIIFASAPNTGSDFFIVTYGSLNIAVPADNSVTSAKIVDGTIVGTDLATNIDLVDNQKLRLGSSQNLEIFYDGSHSYIADTGSGNLNVTASRVNINNAANSENIARFIESGAVELYHAGSKKFETASYGVSTDGLMNFNGTGTKILIGDNGKITLGGGSDLEIFHNSHNFIHADNGDLNLCIESGSKVVVQESTSGSHLAEFNFNGGVELFFDGSKKLETASDKMLFHAHAKVNADATYDLGASGARWNNLYIAGIINSSGNVSIGTNDNEPAQLELKYSTVPTYLTSTFDGTFGEATLSVNVPRTSDGSSSWGSHSNTGYGSAAIQVLSHSSSGGRIAFLTGNADNTNPTQKMFIDSAGRVGINESSAANTLQVKNINSTTHPALFKMTGAHFYAAAIMDNDGTNGGGAATFTSHRISNSIKGDITFNGSVMVYGGTSDYRLKENVVSINDGIAKIKQLNPLRYNFIDNPSHTCEGFFAHEAQTICPQSATGTKDEIATEDIGTAVKRGDPVYQQMDYSKLVPLLTAGLKEAIAKIETLETKVAALEVN